MHQLRTLSNYWQIRSFAKTYPVVINSLISLSLLIFATSASHALEVSVDISGNAGGNTNTYGTTVDINGDVTSWGSNFKDYVVKFQSGSGTTLNIDNFTIQLTANPGQSVGTNTLNVTWFNWVDATSQTNPNWSNRVGTLGVTSSTFAAFGTVLVGPTNFSPSPITATSSGSTYFFRVWSNGTSANTGYGVKFNGNSLLEYNVSDPNLDVYNYDGSTFSSTPASTFTPVPEPSTYLLCGLAAGVLVWSRRWRFLQSETVVGHS